MANMHCYHNYLNIPAQLVHLEDVSITVVKIHKSFAVTLNLVTDPRALTFLNPMTERFVM